MPRANFARGEELLKSGYRRQGRLRSALQHDAVRPRRRWRRPGRDRRGASSISATPKSARPFAGRLGRNQAAKGAWSARRPAAQHAVQLDPIYVTFNPSETELAEIEAARAAGKVEAEISTPGDGRAGPQGRTDLPRQRRSTARPARSSARVTHRRIPISPLLPGQYVRVRLHMRDEPDALMAPEAALGSSQMGKFVYVVGDGDKVELRPIDARPGGRRRSSA